MQYKTHALGGITTGLIASHMIVDTLQATPSLPLFLTGASVYASVTVGGFIGSLFPDVDHPNSYMGRRLPFLSRPIQLASKTSKDSFLKHRGLFHTLLFVFCLSLGLYALMSYFIDGLMFHVLRFFLIGFFLGNVNHILLDTCTKSGTYLFYPFVKKKISILPVVTGSFSEVVFAGVYLLSMIVIIGGM